MNFSNGPMLDVRRQEAIGGPTPAEVRARPELLIPTVLPRLISNAVLIKRFDVEECRRAWRSTRSEILTALSDQWLPDLVWPFPTWSVRARPFDYEIDA